MQGIDGEPESSENKKGSFFKSESKKFTVYKLVVTLEDRSYLVFRRWSMLSFV